jgi:nicotinamidase-related amidase
VFAGQITAESFMELNEYKKYDTIWFKTENYANWDFSPVDMVMVIDMQNDFVDAHVDGLTGPDVPGKGIVGAFAVTNGADAIRSITEFYDNALNAGSRVVFTRDVHPCDHCSFFAHACEEGITPTQHKEPGPFPPHCVNKSIGSGLVPDIYADLKEKQSSLVGKDSAAGKFSVVFKGCNAKVDSFGAFKYQDPEYLKKRQLGDCQKDNPDLTGSFYAA